MSNAPVIVYGEGSAAVFLIQELLQKGEKIVWAAGSGAKLLPVMPYVTSELALATLLHAQKSLTDEIFANPVEKGVFHRVFRNKGFKLPSWKRTSNPETQKQAYEDLVWAPEQAYIGVQELRIAGLTPTVLEQSLREHFENHESITRVATAPVVELEIAPEGGGKIQFANGTITEFKQFFFCDSLNELKTIPKLLGILKLQMANVKASNMMSALQVVFTHSDPLNQAFETGLVIPLNRESGESFDRDALGYFMEPNKSVWTLFMKPEEGEENHEIMKKLRKLKQALNKAFDSPEFLPEGKKEFMATVEKEQVHFEEGFLVIDGSLKDTVNSDFVLLPDAFGLTMALEKIAERFEIEPIEFSLTSDADQLIEAESESVSDQPEAQA